MTTETLVTFKIINYTTFCTFSALISTEVSNIVFFMLSKLKILVL